MAYSSLNDAAKYDQRLAKGTTKIFYAKSEFGRDFRMGHRFLSEHEPHLLNLESIKNTHELLGEIQEKDHEEIYTMLQGEFWSPFGEAYDFIRAKGLSHTSISVGDVIEVDGIMYMVDGCGFKQL